MRIVLQKKSDYLQQLDYAKLASGITSGVWGGETEATQWVFDSDRKMGSFTQNAAKQDNLLQ